MGRLLSIDIETKCNAKKCPAPLACSHALSPRTGVITVVGMAHEDSFGKLVTRAFRDMKILAMWLDALGNDGIGYQCVGHNFSFDMHFLRAANVYIPASRWMHDTKLMASLIEERVSEDFLSAYEKERDRRNAQLTVPHRPGRALSLKTLAPYFLDVPPFWENPASHDDDEYALKDAVYTLDLCKIFTKRLIDEGKWRDYTRTKMEWLRVKYYLERTKAPSALVRTVNEKLGPAWL